MATAIQAAVPKPLRSEAEHLLVEDKDQEANNHPDVRRAENNAGDRRSVPWFTLLGLLILTFNSGMAIVRSGGDAMAIAFVVFSYADLLALFACLRMYERAPAGSSTRAWLKVAVWVLTTLLTFAFSSKVAAVMPPAAAVLVWLMAFATVAGGFVAFFVYKEKATNPPIHRDACAYDYRSSPAVAQIE